MREGRKFSAGGLGISLLIGFVRLLPHRLALAFGRLLGHLLRLVSWKRVDRCESRCVLALGVGVTLARGIVRRSFSNLGMSAVEFARMEALLPRLRDYVSIEGKEHFDEALSRGRGVLLMTAHIGNWEMAGARLVQAGVPLVPIYTPQRNQGGINDLIQRQRTEVAGMKMVPSEGAGMRGIFRALKGGKVVAVLQDLDAREEGVPLSFLGLPARTADGIVKLHRKFGSPVLPALCIRYPDRVHHRILFQEILSDLKDEDGNPFGANVAKSLRMCHNVLEKWVRTYPDQWLWLIDRWESTLR